MIHEAWREKLLDLAYGELSPREARNVEVHAEGCADCRTELAKIRETRRLMAGLPTEAAPERGERVLLAAAREAAGRRPARRWIAPWFWGVSVAAASVVAVGAVTWRIASMRPGPLQRPDTQALLGDSPYAARTEEPPASAAPAPSAPRPREKDEAMGARGSGEKATRARFAQAPPPGKPEEAAPAMEAASPERKGARAPRGEGKARSEGRSEAIASAPEPSDAPAPAPGRAGIDVPAAAAERLRPPPSLDRSLSKAPAAEEGFFRKEAEPAADAYGALRAAGGLRGEIRTFRGCEGEAWRKVETDPEGRVLRYVREGRIDGRRLRIEHAFGPDGALAGVTVRDLDRPEAAVDAEALGLLLPARAADARIDAPPRCGR